MCSSWAAVHIYSTLYNNKYPGYSLNIEVRECLDRMRFMLVQHVQLAYKLLKMWPSLAIGAILRDLEHSDEFLKTITQDLPFSLKATDFYKHEVSTIMGPTHAMISLDIIGLWKTMGHPIVDMDETTKSWMNKGLVMKQDLGEAAEDICNMFKKEFCRQFYKSHNKWPAVSLGFKLNPHIRTCILENEWGRHQL
ncbi:unnamed protein product [Parnassius apollo]|uniref:(apollo) hypothetical protein n=1 Tax=Parnassius apollo TaxID=110799 RepID=A0A8S3W2Z8_PARAO|nr:unnamed protein product [Parnassius apollo]